MNSLEIKNQFLSEREKIFNNPEALKDAFKFCVNFSLLVEEFIRRIAGEGVEDFALASGGSFSRRELSPFSDIDLIFICREVKGKEKWIEELVRDLWDGGIEVSHTVREFKDISRFLDERDLPTFTQFFETRFLLGRKEIYNEWNEKLLNSIDDSNRSELVYLFFEDISKRHIKYGDSPKILEPNIKFSAGGLRDLQVVEWIYSIKEKTLLTNQNEITQTESFLHLLKTRNFISMREFNNVLESYKLILNVRNLLHLLNNRKSDRLEFSAQEEIAVTFGYSHASWQEFMSRYFACATSVNRFSNTMIRLFDEQITHPLSDYLSIKLDDDFFYKGGSISVNKSENLTMSEILRAFYYRGLYKARFDEKLRTLSIESLMQLEEVSESEQESSVFFREILKLPSNVAETLNAMNELGALGAFLPEFKELVGFFQPGVYHSYTADEHTILAIKNLEKLRNENSVMGKIFSGLKEKDILYLAVLLHDIAKPLSVSGHEIIGAEVAYTILERLVYSQEEIELIKFLVRRHLTMEQTAFRRNLNDPATLDNFISIFPSLKYLDMLYLLTYGDLSAVSPIVWNNWKSDLLLELYQKARAMFEEKVSGEELLYANTLDVIKKSKESIDENMIEHIESINDFGYVQHYSEDEINQHIEEIEKGSNVSVFFKEERAFTNITVITKDSPSLLSRLCGSLAINDLNIHDARIFTRKDAVVIDSFNVTDFRSHEIVNPNRYSKIENDIVKAAANELEIKNEFTKMKSRWTRLESKLFGRKSRVKVQFEEHDKFTIIDIFSPDRLGLLYQITKKINTLNLSIYFAKIATQGDDVVDSFYTLRNGKVISPNDYGLIEMELKGIIEEML